MVKSDAMVHYLGSVIAADLNEWHLVLAGKGKHGKGNCSNDLAKFLSNSEHELCRGKSTTSDTVLVWVNLGKEAAEKEEIRRTQEASNGNNFHSTGSDAQSIPPYASIWCALMQAYREYTNTHSTSVCPRYLEPSCLA